jgi:hypothetical protein
MSNLRISRNLLKNSLIGIGFKALLLNWYHLRSKINSGIEADKAASDFTASIASAYRLSTSKITLLDINNELPGLDQLLKYKQRLRKMWQETRNPACKTSVNWVTKQIRRMTRKKALERWDTKIGNCEVIPQSIWPIGKSLPKRDGPREPTAIHGPLGPKFLPLEKTNEIADCLENQFMPHDLCDKNHERRVEARVQALLEAVDNNHHKKLRTCDLQKLINSPKLKEPAELMALQIYATGTFQRDH